MLIGAFFLLNLTLAVINAKFTEAHKKQQEKDLNEFQAMNKHPSNGSDEMDAAIKSKDEMSIAQYITARIYAKKMIEFLRMRQEIKRIETERMNKVKAMQKADKEAKRIVSGSKPPPKQVKNGKTKSPPGSGAGSMDLSAQKQRSQSSNNK